MPELVIYIIIILTILFAILFIVNIANSAILEKRIGDFSLSKDDLNEESYAERIKRKIWQNIHLLSNNLGKSKTLEVLSRDYSKYIMTSEENFKSPIDYMTIKILSTIIFIVLVMVFTILKIIPDNFVILAIGIIIGYIFPDIFWNINYYNKKKEISNHLYESIIILSDSLKQVDIEDAIFKILKTLDGPIQDEYKKILIDLSYNISLSDAYKRFYARTDIKEIKTIYHILDINSDNLSEAFNLIRNQFDYINEKNSITSNTNSILNVMSYIYLLIPLIFMLMVIIIYPKYLRIFKEYTNGPIFLILIILLYLFLVISIKSIMEDRK
jgi:Flp pilus assembly protein TadB